MRPGNRLIAICAAVGLGLASVSAWAGEVRQVLLNTGATGTRAEISLVGSGGYKTLSLAGPNRLVVDFPDSSAIRNLKMPAAQGVVTAVRTGQPVPGTFRVVFDLAESVAPFRPQMQREGNESKLVIEWPGDGPAVAASRPAVTPAVQPPGTGQHACTDADADAGGERAVAFRCCACHRAADCPGSPAGQCHCRRAGHAHPGAVHCTGPGRGGRYRGQQLAFFVAGRDPGWTAHRSGGDHAAGYGACTGTDASGTAASGHAQRCVAHPHAGWHASSGGGHRSGSRRPGSGRDRPDRQARKGCHPGGGA
jgi:Localisation of periplasmic protein complexes.